ncbi:hypothetical protein CRYUN_Cryun12cG0125700 [Craigia yunnanensis]
MLLSYILVKFCLAFTRKKWKVSFSSLVLLRDYKFAQNKKTKKSKHFGFIEFKNP